MIYKSHKTLMFYGIFLSMQNLTQDLAYTEGFSNRNPLPNNIIMPHQKSSNRAIRSPRFSYI
jgi:hypothetical protein